MFNVGDKVKVKDEWLKVHPDSPLPKQDDLTITEPGDMVWPGEVSINMPGVDDIWYVQEPYVIAA